MKKKNEKAERIREILGCQKGLTGIYERISYAFLQEFDPIVFDNCEIEMIVHMLRQQKNHINDTIELKVSELRKLI
jgi:hypothetical protein